MCYEVDIYLLGSPLLIEIEYHKESCQQSNLEVYMSTTTKQPDLNNHELRFFAKSRFII